MAKPIPAVRNPVRRAKPTVSDTRVYAPKRPIPDPPIT